MTRFWLEKKIPLRINYNRSENEWSGTFKKAIKQIISFATTLELPLLKISATYDPVAMDA